MPTRPAWTTAALAAVTAGALVWLAAGLPAGAFFSGDSGVKLIAALDAIGHPGRPFEIDLPRIGGRPTTLVDPMVVVHGDHGHPLQSPLFPPLSAPLIAALGLRGAFVLPALAFVALVPLLELIRRRAAPDVAPSALAWLTIGASPLLLYALEFWEHAPAVALLTAATAAALGGAHGASSTRLAAAGGALAGAGVLLRPEGAWYAAGLVLTIARPRWLAFACGAAAVGLPFAAANYAHFGNPLGAHASAVLAPIGVEFLAGRLARLHEWVWPSSAALAAGLLLVAAAWVPGRLAKDERARQLLALLGVAVVAVLAARGSLPQGSFWQGFPLALLALVPVSAGGVRVRQLAALATVSVAGVVLTATNDGGAQWGVRYLLIAAPPLLLLAARGATGASGAGPWRGGRLAAIVVICLAGAMTSRTAYLELRGTKRNYDGLVSATASFVPPGDIIVTNVWWLDQVAAALHGTRTFLFVPDAASASGALADLRGEHIDRVTLAWAADSLPFSLERTLDGACFRITAIRDVPVRGLRLASARCVPE